MTSTAVRAAIRLSTVAEMRACAGDLFDEHYQEITRNKELLTLSPAWERYEQLEAAGALFTIGAWVGQTMVGYSANFIGAHLHYSGQIFAQNDVLFVSPEYRRGSVGLQLIRETERIARDRGACLLLWHAKAHTALDAVLPRLGYDMHETIYSRGL